MLRRVWILSVMLAATMPCAAWTSAASGGPPDSTGTPAPPPAWTAGAIPQTPPDFPRGRISGLVFADYYYNAAGDPTHVYDASGADAGQAYIDARKPITRDLNGLQIRRVYLQVDNDLSVRFASRFRLEADSRSLTSDGKIGVNVKNAYLQAKSIIPRGDLFVGMLSTPTWEGSEEFWQYRSVERTMADFRGIGGAADLGIELKGFVDADHHFGYAAMMGDGTGQKPENDRFKKWYLTLPVHFGDFRIEPYVDYQSLRLNLDRVKPVQSDSAAVNHDQATYKLFAGYEFRRWALGAEVVDRVNHKGSAASEEPRGYSLFARGTATPTLAAFARVDHWVADRRKADRVDSRLWILGLDWQPFKDLHVMPNVEATQYLPSGTTVAPPYHDVQARVTLYYRFSRPES
jgi:YD repeat-containing protein